MLRVGSAGAVCTQQAVRRRRDCADGGVPRLLIFTQVANEGQSEVPSSDTDVNLHFICFVCVDGVRPGSRAAAQEASHVPAHLHFFLGDCRLRPLPHARDMETITHLTPRGF